MGPNHNLNAIGYNITVSLKSHFFQDRCLPAGFGQNVQSAEHGGPLNVHVEYACADVWVPDLGKDKLESVCPCLGWSDNVPEIAHAHVGPSLRGQNGTVVVGDGAWRKIHRDVL